MPHPWQPGARLAVWSSWVNGEYYGPGDYFPPGTVTFDQFLVRIPLEVSDTLGNRPALGIHALPIAITGDVDLSARYYYYTPAMRDQPYQWCENVKITFNVGTSLRDRYAAISALLVKVESKTIRGTSVTVSNGNIGPNF